MSLAIKNSPPTQVGMIMGRTFRQPALELISRAMVPDRGGGPIGELRSIAILFPRRYSLCSKRLYFPMHKEYTMSAAHSRIASVSVLLFTAVISIQSVLAQQNFSVTELKYQVPPQAMVKLVDALPPPTISLSPAHGVGPRRILIQQSSSLPTIADLAEPELRLAGLRFNPKVSAPSRTRYFVSLKLQALPAAGAGAQPATAIAGLPAKLHVLSTEWSSDGQHIALVNADGSSPAQESAGLSLWIVDVAKASAAQVPGVRLNSVLADPI